MIDRERFLEAIKADRYNQQLRWVYADWLEENGFDDEAAEQRAWTREKQEAEDFLRDYAARLCREPYEESGYGGFSITYEELLEVATTHLERGDQDWSGTLCLPYDTPDFVWETQKEFWRHFKLLTGLDVPEDYNEGFIHCAC